MTKYFAALLIFLAAWPSHAADLNGYTAQYECRAGGPNCNIDVVTLTNQACQQTINPGDAWNTINWSNNVICIASGYYVIPSPVTTTMSRGIKQHQRESLELRWVGKIIGLFTVCG
jgi:hypothetical protein